MSISNPKLQHYAFLQDMVEDGYFPDFLVDKGKAILVGFCEAIEAGPPKNLAELYVLSHAATEAFNQLAEEFDANGSDLETVARECIAADFSYVAEVYGFDADAEELIAPREW